MMIVRNGKPYVNAGRLSAMSGLSRSDISRLWSGERGERSAWKTIEGAAHALGVRAEWLANGEDPKRLEDPPASEWGAWIKAKPGLADALKQAPNEFTVLDVLTAASLDLSPLRGQHEPARAWLDRLRDVKANRTRAPKTNDYDQAAADAAEQAR